VIVLPRLLPVEMSPVRISPPFALASAVPPLPAWPPFPPFRRRRGRRAGAAVGLVAVAAVGLRVAVPPSALIPTPAGWSPCRR
jgi:hypothetical protein